MKKLIVLFTLLVSLTFSFAGEVNDSANILGHRDVELAQNIKNLPVFIETHVSLPDIKSYADSRVKELTSKGFIIVVTTNPRKWRISMTPERVTSGESTRIIGEAMVPSFKRGDYYSGFLGAANSLNALIISGNQNYTRVENENIAQTEATIGNHRKIEKIEEANGTFTIVFVVVGVIVLIIGAVFLSKTLGGGSVHGISNIAPKKKEYTNITSSFDIPAKASTPQVYNQPVKSTKKLTKEEKAFNKYTYGERKRLADKHYGYGNYDSNMLNDHLMFYLFYSTVLDNHNHSHNNYISNDTAAPSYESPSKRESSRDDSSSSSSWSSPSSSDYSGSSGSDWSSSSDSGSSFSDSGGSSGDF